MPSVHKSVLLLYSAEQMYTLVHDVEFYPAFLPWCSEAIVHERSLHHVVATLGIQFRGYIDFGVREQDYRGALRMKGEA